MTLSISNFVFFLSHSSLTPNIYLSVKLPVALNSNKNRYYLISNALLNNCMEKEDKTILAFFFANFISKIFSERLFSSKKMTQMTMKWYLVTALHIEFVSNNL